MDTRASNSIFDRIGGRETVRAVVDDFYRRVLQDPALAPAFAGTDLQRLHRHQMQFLTVALGGAAVYSGRSLQQAHRGRGITKAQFGGVTSHLHEALRGVVPEPEIEQILVTVASLQSQIVGR